MAAKILSDYRNRKVIYPPNKTRYRWGRLNTTRPNKEWALQTALSAMKRAHLTWLITSWMTPLYLTSVILKLLQSLNPSQKDSASNTISAWLESWTNLGFRTTIKEILISRSIRSFFIQETLKSCHHFKSDRSKTLKTQSIKTSRKDFRRLGRRQEHCWIGKTCFTIETLIKLPETLSKRQIRINLNRRLSVWSRLRLIMNAHVPQRKLTWCNTNRFGT